MKLIDFYADWCGPCHMMKPILEDAISELGSVEMEKVDVDANSDKASSFNVMSIPTLVLVDDGGKEIDRKVGAMSKDELVAWVREHGN